MSGILAMWNDCAPGLEEFYEAWYQEEHLFERLAIPGFNVGRRYQAVDAARGFMTTYEVASSAVLTSEAYLARLASPTPRTRVVMADGFRNMTRTVCDREILFGRTRGTFAVAAVAVTDDARSLLTALSSKLPATSSLAHGEIWLSAEPVEKEVSAEEAIRGGDDKISGCLLHEFLHESAARDQAAAIRQAESGLQVGIYRLMCMLQSEEAS